MPRAAPRGRFITVEGGEGVGKSVFTVNLTNGIRDFGVTLVTTREPGGTPTADKIRALFAVPAVGDALLMPAEALLVSAARAQHVGRLIEPALARGDWVLSDRFADSTRVYQGALGGLPPDRLEQLIDFSIGPTVPDLTFLLDCDVATARRRLAARGSVATDAIDRYDDQANDFHERLRQAYLALARGAPKRFVVLDASQKPDLVVRTALAQLEDRLGRP